MKHNRAGYYIKEGVSSIFTHGFMSFASVFIIVSCLIIMGSFTLLAVNVDKVIGTLQDDSQILAFVDDSLSESDALALRSQIESIDNITSVEFISRDEAMDDFVDSYDDPSLFEGLDASVFRHRYIIYVDNLSQLAVTRNEVIGIRGIAKVSAHFEISDALIRARNIVTIVSVVLVAILFLVSLFIMSNTIKLTTFERRDEIAIMKMVGATSGFIRWPFVVEGLLLGLFGSLTAYLLQWCVYEFVFEHIISNAGLNFVTVMPFAVMAIPLLVIFIVIGLSVGIIGSLVAIRNYLKV